MVIDMNEAKLTPLERVRAFLAGTVAVEFSLFGRGDERYGQIAAVLNRFGYKAEETRKGMGAALSSAPDGLLAAATHADRQALGI